MNKGTVPTTKEEWVAHLKAHPDLWADLALETMYEAKKRLEVLEMVRKAAEAFLEFVEAWDTIDPAYRDELRRVINLAKAVPG